MNGVKTCLALLVLAAPAAADEVVLRNGAVFSGVAHEEGDRVVVRMDYGTMTFKKIDVRSIRKTDDPLKDLETKTAKASTADEYVAAAVWAKGQGLPGRADELLEKALFLEPNHEAARRALGYERFEGRWLKGDELRVARGYVKHGGKWLKRETVEQILAQENAESIELERQKTIRQVAEMEREVELQKIALERERIEAELEKARRTSWWRTGLWPSGPGVVILPPAHPCRPPAHPGHGPGRTLPPPTERVFPGGIPSLTPPAHTTRGGGPPVFTK